MDLIAAQRAIATLHSFRFFGLVFILPGVVGPNLPVAGFAAFAAYWDLATGVLAILALLTVRVRPLFWLFVVAFNLVGIVDLVLDYYHATQVGLPALAGQLGATYAIPIIYVPVLMITHVVAFYLLLRPQAQGGSSPRRRCGGILESPRACLPSMSIADATMRKKLVPGEGVEPTRPCGQRILSPQRLPFRHPGIGRSSKLTCGRSRLKANTRAGREPVSVSYLPR